MTYTKVGGKSNLKILVYLMKKNVAPKSFIALGIGLSQGFSCFKVTLVEWLEFQISLPLSYDWNNKTMR